MITNIVNSEMWFKLSVLLGLCTCRDTEVSIKALFVFAEVLF